MRRRGRARGHAPAPQWQVCGRCGVKCPTPAELEIHSAWCWQAPDLPAPPDPTTALSNAMVAIFDRMPADQAASLNYAILRTAHGMDDEQRARLAWLVNEFTDCLPETVTAP